MAHFARINARGFVSQVIVAEQGFIDSLPDADSWVQTSYNTFGGVHYNPETGKPDDGVALRKNYAGVGFTYDKIRDAFIPPRPHSSWFLVEESCLWQSPEPMPDLSGAPPRPAPRSAACACRMERYRGPGIRWRSGPGRRRGRAHGSRCGVSRPAGSAP